MRLLHALARTRVSFDDPNLLSHAGLVPLAALAERSRLHDSADLLRHGAMDKVFGGVRAPSTLGSFLRAFTWGKRERTSGSSPGSRTSSA